MKLISKQNWKYGYTVYEIEEKRFSVYQNTDNGQWQLVNDSDCELVHVAKTKKEVITTLKDIAENKGA